MTVVSLAFGLIFGDIVGLSLLLALLLLWLSFHLYHIALLLRWLGHPVPGRVPDGFGSWHGIFMTLYRQARKQKQSKKRLAGVLDRFVNAGEAMPDGVVVLDEYDHIEWINPLAVEHLGLNRKTDIGSQILNLVRQPAFHDYMAAQSYSQPLILHGGNSKELVLSRDITQLERVQTVHRDFVANVSHELRTPLTVVGGFLETLSDMPQVEDATLRQFLPMMLEQSRRMQNLVEDLLTLSRIENGPRTVLHDLWGSAQELHSAFGNLVSNAVRYTPEGGSIYLRWTQEDDGRVAFTVADTGIGIPREHLPRLTERFYRVDRGRSRGNGGTGLGLAIVKHVIARHNARLEIRSEPDKGSTFSVIFQSERA